MHDEEELSVDEERRLRSALATIGSTSAEQARASEKTRQRSGESSARHRLRWPLMGAAAAVALVACVGTGIALDRSGQPTTAGFTASGQDERLHGQTLPEWIACSRAIAIGDITKVTGTNTSRIKVTMHVNKWIRPTHGSSTLSFTDRNPSIDGGRPTWRVGGPVLVRVSENPSSPVRSFRGKDLTLYRDLVQGGLDDASKTACRSPWAASAG